MKQLMAGSLWEQLVAWWHLGQLMADDVLAQLIARSLLEQIVVLLRLVQLRADSVLEQLMEAASSSGAWPRGVSPAAGFAWRVVASLWRHLVLALCRGVSPLDPLPEPRREAAQDLAELRQEPRDEHSRAKRRCATRAKKNWRDGAIQVQ